MRFWSSWDEKLSEILAKSTFQKWPNGQKKWSDDDFAVKNVAEFC